MKSQVFFHFTFNRIGRKTRETPVEYLHGQPLDSDSTDESEDEVKEKAKKKKKQPKPTYTKVKELNKPLGTAATAIKTLKHPLKSRTSKESDKDIVVIRICQHGRIPAESPLPDTMSEGESSAADARKPTDANRGKQKASPTCQPSCSCMRAELSPSPLQA